MIDASYLLISLSYFLVSLACFYAYYSWLLSRIRCAVSRQLLVLSFSMLFPAAMYLMWGTGYVSPVRDDFAFVTGFFAVIASIVMLLLAYRWTENQHLLYVLVIYAITIVAVYINLSAFSSILTVAAFLVSLIVFLDLFIASSSHVRLGSAFGSVYAVFALVLVGVSAQGYHYPVILWALPNFFLAAAIYMIYLDGKYCMSLHPKPLAAMHHKKVRVHVVFLRYFAYTISMAGLILIATISVHELGHAVSSQLYGCEQARIVFDFQNFPHTELVCNNTVANLFVITLAGLVATSAVAGVLIFTLESFAVKLGKLMLIYGFIISY